MESYNTALYNGHRFRVFDLQTSIPDERVKCVLTGEYRVPQKDEWYVASIKGVVTAIKADGTETEEHSICTPVQLEEIEGQEPIIHQTSSRQRMMLDSLE